MSRYQPHFYSAAEVDSASVAAMLAAWWPVDASADRHSAMVCCLTGANGWREASARLGGSFATGATRLATTIKG